MCLFGGRKQEFEPKKRPGSWMGCVGGYMETYLRLTIEN